MLSQQTTAYYNNWMMQLKNATGNQPEDHFTRFRILYPLQNKLYSEASLALLSKGSIAARGNNKEEATKNLVMFLGAAKMINLFQEKNEEDVQHLIGILENKIFNITLSMRGVPQPQRDQELLVGLKSANVEGKALAIVTIIYQVRCKDTHGEKIIDKIQPLLLEPINNLISTINDMLYAELSK